jgi:putative DNA primase/helicase
MNTFDHSSESIGKLPPQFKSEDGWLIHIDNDRTTRICTNIEVLGRTSNVGGGGWGLLLRWINDDGEQQVWAMPSELLASPYGIEVRRHLLNHGLHIEPEPDAHRLLMTYLSHRREGASRVFTTSRTGWTEDLNHFVLPDETLGSKQSNVIYLPGDGPLNDDSFTVSGTLAEWREHVSRYCAGSVLLVIAVCASMAAIFLRLLGDESGGLHYYGPTSKGKSTILSVGRSVWGSGTASWNATKNGLEAIAERYNDSLLALDEIGEADANDLMGSVYMLANGTGRARMTAGITARRTADWKNIILSSGEVSVANHASTAGKQMKGGVDIRLLNLPIEAHPEWGAFEALHELDSPKQLAQTLNENVRKYHGSPSRALLESVLADKEGIVQRARHLKSDFVQRNVGVNHSSEVQRAADRLALFAAVGTIATEIGITAWRKDEAFDAASRGYKIWIASRGTAGATDAQVAIRQIRKFLEVNGSRFLINEDRPATNVYHCAGLKEADGSKYYVSPEVFRTEVCAGLDSNQVVKVLKREGHLDMDADNRHTKKVRVKVKGISQTRFYVVNSSIFQDDDGDGIDRAI